MHIAISGCKYYPGKKISKHKTEPKEPKEPKTTAAKETEGKTTDVTKPPADTQLESRMED